MESYSSPRMGLKEGDKVYLQFESEHMLAVQP